MNKNVKPVNAILVAGVAFALYLYSVTDSMLLAVVVCIISLIIQMVVESSIQSKNRGKAAEKIASYGDNTQVNRIMKLAESPSPNLNTLYMMGARILFKGKPRYIEHEATTGVITSQFCYLKNHYSLMNKDTGVDFVEATDLTAKANFVTEKYEYTISGRTAMDVQGAAILGNALGGIGAAASAAANAAEINSQGGLVVHQKMTAYHILLVTPGQETLIEELYLTEKGKLTKVDLPGKMDKKTANDIVSRLNAAKNGAK